MIIFECLRLHGTVICHHKAALAIYTHYIPSSTDKACSQSFRKSNQPIEVKTINEIYGHFDFLDITPIEEDINKFKNEISNFPITIEFSQLLQPVPELFEHNNIMLVDAIKTVV